MAHGASNWKGDWIEAFSDESAQPTPPQPKGRGGKTVSGVP